nr:hypothetical protein [Nostoc sp. ChiSLP03a]MDZ8211621.1 hypothetical protein [Nostoc sp. ChiSLP03a]
MAIKNDRRNHDRQKDDQRNCENITGRLGVPERESISARHESDTIFYSDSEGRNQARSWIAHTGETTPGGIYRRLKELHEVCLTVIESQQKQLENSLHNSKQLTEEIENLHVLLAEVLQDVPHKE